MAEDTKDKAVNAVEEAEDSAEQTVEGEAVDSEVSILMEGYLQSLIWVLLKLIFFTFRGICCFFKSQSKAFLNGEQSPSLFLIA